MIFVQHFAVYAALRIKTAEVTCDNEMHQLESLLACFNLTFFCCKKHSQHHLAKPDFQAKDLHLEFHLHRWQKFYTPTGTNFSSGFVSGINRLPTQ